MGVFIAAFILFIPTGIITLYLFNGSLKYIFIPLCIPFLYIGISSIKNRVSILRLRGQKWPSRETSAVTFGWLLIGVVTIQLLFVFISDSTPMSSFLTRFFVSPSSNGNQFLPIFDGTSTKQIYRIEDNSQFIEQKIFTEISAGGAYKEIPLAFYRNMVIFAGGIGSTDWAVNPDLINADISSGKINWQISIGTGVIAIDANNVYAQLPNKLFSSAAGVAAYDMVTGSKLWETTLDWRNAIGIDYLAITNDLLSVGTYNRGDDAFYVIEPASGKVETVVALSTDLFMIADGTDYQSSTRVIAARGASNWRTEFNTNIYSDQSFQSSAPVVTNDLILVKIGNWALGSAAAVRKTDGSIVWQNDQIITSNIAVGGSITYFVSDTSKLIAVNTETGKVLGSVNFAPSFADNHDFINTRIYVAAYNNIVAVYFEDTRQLSIIMFKSP
jgi:hypothetical protein